MSIQPLPVVEVARGLSSLVILHISLRFVFFTPFCSLPLAGCRLTPLI